ncbi:MAG: FIST C-terminal domain-containing protein [Alphaproteobacteria bacterium]|nr:FIST C-terminal domain-containing protein [Alphaproteobacteria bacterium]
MKSLSLNTDAVGLPAALETLANINPQLLIVFADKRFLADAAQMAVFPAARDGFHIIGCSSAGEISGDGASVGKITLMAIHFENTGLRVSSACVAGDNGSYMSGQSIAMQLATTPGLKSIFALSPGLGINGSAFAAGLADGAPAKTVITGGLAGDGTAFKDTLTLLDGKVSNDCAVAFGLYGDNISVGSGSQGGWKPFGPIRSVTRAVNNILYELDGKPALELYKTYLGDKAAELPSSGLLYPLSIVDAQHRTETGLIRTILDINEAENSIILAGNLPQNSLVRLMHADIDSLVEGAESAAQDAGKAASSPTATLMVSCVGRRLVMGHDIDEEVDAVTAQLGKSAYAGFYSYGEVSPFGSAGRPELHNQTMTITTFSEKTGPARASGS